MGPRALRRLGVQGRRVGTPTTARRRRPASDADRATAPAPGRRRGIAGKHEVTRRLRAAVAADCPR